MIVTPNQIAILCYGANWGDPRGDGEDASRIVAFLDDVIAIAHGESSWNTDAVNGNAVGLFQIMTSVHKDRIGDRDMRKPHYNVQVARELSMASYRAGNGLFQPWEAYNKKTAGYRAGKGHGKSAYAYLKSKSHAERLQEYISISEVDVGEAIPIDPLADAGGAIAGVVTSPITQALDFIRKGASVVGVFVLGLLLVIAGLWFLASRSKAGKSVASAVGSVVPAGKAAKAAKGLVK